MNRTSRTCRRAVGRARIGMLPCLLSLQLVFAAGLCAQDDPAESGPAAAPDDPITEFQEPLRRHAEAAEGLIKECGDKIFGPMMGEAIGGLVGDAVGAGAMAPGGAGDAKAREEAAAKEKKRAEYLRALRDLTRREIEELREFQRTIAKFRNGRTRRGLIEEFELIDRAITAHSQLTALIEGLGTAEAQQAQLKKRMSTFEQLLKESLELVVADVVNDHVARKLRIEGLEEILLVASWDEAREAVGRRLRSEVRAQIEKKTFETVGFAFHDVDSMKQGLRLAVRRRVEEWVGKLVIDLGGNGIVVRLAQELILDWLGEKVWPKIREALRPKGNHEPRVDVSLGTLEESRRELNALGSDEDPSKVELSKVRAAVDKAEQRLAATRYLEGDLKRAGRSDLLSRLDEGKKHLARTIRLAERRFLLDRAEKMERLGERSPLLRQNLRTLMDLEAALGRAAGPAGAR